MAGAETCDQLHALVYLDPATRLYWYIPTAPKPARQWRGSFASSHAMRCDMLKDMGGEPHETRTKLGPNNEEDGQ
jgi:hypothetical protein